MHKYKLAVIVFPFSKAFLPQKSCKLTVKFFVLFFLLTATFTMGQPQPTKQLARLFPPASYDSLTRAVRVLAEDDLWTRFDELSRNYIFHRNHKSRLNRTCIREPERVMVNRDLQRNWAEMADIYTAIRQAILQVRQVGHQLSGSSKTKLQQAGATLYNSSNKLQQLWKETLYDAQTSPSLAAYPFQRIRQPLNNIKRNIVLFLYRLEHWRVCSSGGSNP